MNTFYSSLTQVYVYKYRHPKVFQHIQSPMTQNDNIWVEKMAFPQIFFCAVLSFLGIKPIKREQKLNLFWPCDFGLRLGCLLHSKISGLIILPTTLGGLSLPCLNVWKTQLVLIKSSYMNKSPFYFVNQNRRELHDV